MRKKRLLLIAAALGLTLVGLITWDSWTPSEPVYQGKRLSYWLLAYDLGATDRPDNGSADRAIQAIGTNSIPTLLRMLRTHDSSLNSKFASLAEKQPFIAISHPSVDGLYFRAARGFQLLGPRGESAVPQLAAIYDRNLPPPSRSTIARILAGMGSAAKAAVPALVRGLANTNAPERGDTLTALGRIHAQPDLVLPELLKVLQTPASPNHLTAAAALAAYGAEARSTVPVLVKMIRSAPPRGPLSMSSGQNVNLATVLNAPSQDTWPGPMGDRFVRSFSSSEAAAEALKAIDPEAAAQLMEELHTKW
jgi:HEAT repeat protein